MYVYIYIINWITLNWITLNYPIEIIHNKICYLKDFSMRTLSHTCKIDYSQYVWFGMAYPCAQTNLKQLHGEDKSDGRVICDLIKGARWFLSLNVYPNSRGFLDMSSITEAWSQR